jgi:kynurenine formamidase
MKTFAIIWAGLLLIGCAPQSRTFEPRPPVPREIVDLGAVIDEETPARFWGRGLLEAMGFEDQNRFDVIEWSYGPVSGSNSYYRLFNHGGPHVDAPNHIGVGPGLDAWPVEAFVGPLRVFDFSHLPVGRNITVEMLSERHVAPGDIVIIYTGYRLPPDDGETPAAVALTWEAASHLAELPVGAFGTDALNVESMTDRRPVDADSEIAREVPGHYAFLSRGIPVYEQLVNVERLVGRERMYFVGVPLNVADGDGMVVRPVALIY